MEEDLLPAQIHFKLYKDRAVYIGTFVGGPLAAGYFIAQNFKQLGQGDKVIKTWIISIIVGIVVVGSPFMFPIIEKVPKYLIPLIYTGIASLVVQNFQGPQIKMHIKMGGELYSNWRAVLVGIICLIITSAIVLSIIFLANPSAF